MAQTSATAMVEGVAAAARKAGGGASPGQPVVGPAAWTPATLDPSEWAYQLSPTEVDEIVAATRHAVDTGKPIPVRATLPAAAPPLHASPCSLLSPPGPLPHRTGAEQGRLPAADAWPTSGAVCSGGLLGPRLRGSARCATAARPLPPAIAARSTATAGTAALTPPARCCLADAALFAGFPVDRLSQAEAATAWFGFGLHWGTPVSQNAKGHVLGHVKDLGLDPDDDDVRVYATHAAQVWGRGANEEGVCIAALSTS